LSQPKIKTFKKDISSDEMVKTLQEDGCFIFEDFLSNNEVNDIESDLDPFIEATMRSNTNFGGFKTTRTGALMARSPNCRKLAINTRIMSLVKSFLGPYANTFQLHVTQVIRVLPGEKAQMAHRDRWAWSQLQLPANEEPRVNPVLAKIMTEIEPQLNFMLAITDFNEENGATLVAPGSHKSADDAQLPDESFVPAEMSRGSMLVFSGSILHGAGSNTSNKDRIGLNIDYSLGWLRQEDNQYLSCPPELAKDFDPKLQALLGYAVAGPSLGYFTPPLPAGEDLTAPQYALKNTLSNIKLDPDGRLELNE
jgi:ectoine hydroxylase-related dioxygenase (phytanoyl-CoA dioxygenase family)